MPNYDNIFYSANLESKKIFLSQTIAEFLSFNLVNSQKHPNASMSVKQLTLVKETPSFYFELHRFFRIIFVTKLKFIK